MKKSLKQKLTYPLIGLLILIILIVISFFYFDKLFSKPVQINDITIDTKAAMKLNALKQISEDREESHAAVEDGVVEGDIIILPTIDYKNL